MAQFSAFPYLTADPAHITIVKDWHYRKDSGYVVVESLTDDLDHGSVLEFSLDLRVDFLKLLKDCGLDESAVIRLAVAWRSSGTMLRGNGARVDLDPTNTAEPITLHVRVDTSDVTHDLTLVAALILVSPGRKPQRLAPSLAGSLLWSFEKKLSLDSNSLYFPTITADFRSTAGSIPADSAWYLEWDSEELEQSVYSSIILYLNTAHPLISQSISVGTLLPEFVDQFLLFDIARSLIIGALSNLEFVDDPSQFIEGSVGALVFDLLKTYFPNETTASLIEKRSNPGLFEAFLQHHLAFLHRGS